MGSRLQPDNRAMELNSSLAAMHIASLKGGKTFCPVSQLKGKDRDEQLRSAEEIQQPGMDSSSRCPAVVVLSRKAQYSVEGP